MYRFIGQDVHVATLPVKTAKCIVCRLEMNWKPKELGQSKMATGVASSKACGIVAHTMLLPSTNRRIHALPQFQNLTCFEIAHSKEGMELFKRVSSSKGNYVVNKKHPLYLELRMHHGLSTTRKRKQLVTRTSEEGQEINEVAWNQTEHLHVSPIVLATILRGETGQTRPTRVSRSRQTILFADTHNERASILNNDAEPTDSTETDTR